MYGVRMFDGMNRYECVTSVTVPQCSAHLRVSAAAIRHLQSEHSRLLIGQTRAYRWDDMAEHWQFVQPGRAGTSFRGSALAESTG